MPVTIFDLVSEKRAFWNKLETEQWEAWQKRNGNKPKFPENLNYWSKKKLETIFRFDNEEEASTEIQSPASPSPQDLMLKYERELEELELPSPEAIQKELALHGIELEPENEKI